MVHALERIHRWLQPASGRLIDIHPVPTARSLVVRVDDQEWLAGELVDYEKFATYRAADHALAEVVHRGLYTRTGTRQFVFRVQVDTLDDLYDYMSEGELIGDEMDFTVLDEPVARRVEELFATPGRTREVILHRPVRMTRFERR